MFTGLVQQQGQLLARSPRGSGYWLSVAHAFGALDVGESISVNGVCVTVTDWRADRFEADASVETVSRTTLGELAIGTSMHLERAMRVGERFGGHIVSGHVDATTTLLAIEPQGDALELHWSTPEALACYIAEKGSITLDGVSLTVNCVQPSHFTVMVVPHTRQTTHLGLLRRGNVANLEVDILARYVVHWARTGAIKGDARDADAVNAEREASLRNALNRAGFL
ncbi:MAG TPA: riboflavin synthase [Polyangiaceae bacterium]